MEGIRKTLTRPSHYRYVAVSPSSAALDRHLGFSFAAPRTVIATFAQIPLRQQSGAVFLTWVVHHLRCCSVAELVVVLVKSTAPVFYLTWSMQLRCLFESGHLLCDVMVIAPSRP